MLFRAYESPEGRVMGRVVWTSRFRGPGMATKGMLGGTLHQLVHNPETGEATGSCSLAEGFFFFSCAALHCTTSGPGAKETSSHCPYLCECHREDEPLAGSCQPSPQPAFLVRSDHCCPVQWSAWSGCFLGQLFLASKLVCRHGILQILASGSRRRSR